MPTEFNDQIKQFAARVEQIHSSIQTEEATKMSMIIPFFQLLGYDVFNPSEFCPEFTADVGIKKGEKVDYAILENDEPIILVECKWCGETLDKHGSQLFRYFGASSAKFGILTNGIVYRFYTDLEESNKMDLSPFLEINLFDIKDYQLAELKKFIKANFDSDNIFSTASELKYTSYEGAKTQKVIDKFRPIVKKSLTGFINDLVNQKISSALNLKESDSENNAEAAAPEPEEPKSKIVTTQEEIESFYIIRGILAGIVDVNDVVHRDTESYFGILYKDNNRKPICRLNFDTKRSQLYIPDENKNFTRYYIESLNDLYLYKEQLIASVKRYL